MSKFLNNIKNFNLNLFEMKIQTHQKISSEYLIEYLTCEYFCDKFHR